MLRVVALLLAAFGTLTAGPPNAGADACRIHVDAANQAPDDAAEHLFDGARCYEESGNLGASLTLLEHLVSRFPADARVPRALWNLGRGYARLAWYARAADRLEEYALRYAADADAAVALADAIRYRRALGDAAATARSTQRYARTYGRRHPIEAARLTYALTVDLEGRALVDALRDWLDTWALRAPLELRAAAHARMGRVLWDASCPRPSPDGACVQYAFRRLPDPREAKKRSCDEGTLVRVVRRDPSTAARAREHFDAAIALWADGSVTRDLSNAARAQMRDAVGAATFGLAEADFEAAVTVPLPGRLEFTGPRAASSRRRLAAWLRERQEAVRRAEAAYAPLAKQPLAGAWTVPAAFRVGQLRMLTTDALAAADIPRSVPRDYATAYCDALNEQLAPMRKAARDAFATCAEHPAATAASDAWVERCAAAGAAADPQLAPPREHRAMPGADGRVRSMPGPAQ